MPENEGPITARDAAGPFRKGFSGNTKGRPPGQGIAAILGPRRVRDLALTLYKMAKGGDVRAAEVLSTRIWPSSDSPAHPRPPSG